MMAKLGMDANEITALLAIMKGDIGNASVLVECLEELEGLSENLLRALMAPNVAWARGIGLGKRWRFVEKYMCVGQYTESAIDRWLDVARGKILSAVPIHDPLIRSGTHSQVPLVFDLRHL